MPIIAEHLLDIASRDEKVVVRVWAPAVSIAETIDTDGASGLQALALAIKKLSAALYSTELFRTGQLGAFGNFEGYLGIPAPSSFKDIAPYTF